MGSITRKTTRCILIIIFRRKSLRRMILSLRLNMATRGWMSSIIRSRINLTWRIWHRYNNCLYYYNLFLLNRVNLQERREAFQDRVWKVQFRESQFGPGYLSQVIIQRSSIDRRLFRVSGNLHHSMEVCLKSHYLIMPILEYKNISRKLCLNDDGLKKIFYDIRSVSVYANMFIHL